MHEPIQTGDGVTAVREYLGVLRRRWVVVVVVLAAVPLLAVILAVRKPATYAAGADVLLSRTDLAALLNNINDPTAFADPARDAVTQATLARGPAIVQATVSTLPLAKYGPDSLLSNSSVSSDTASNILHFSVTDRSPARAVQLVNEYAHQYTTYRSRLDTAVLARARLDAQRRIDRLRAAGDANSALSRNLRHDVQQLATLEAFPTARATLVGPAIRAKKIGRGPLLDGLIGVALGGVLALGLASLLEALDTRIRSGEDVERRLGLALLTRLAGPPRDLKARNQLVMIESPASTEAEAFRLLRTNLDFATFRKKASVLLIASAIEREGKTTTVANLGVTLARAGRRVVLVDLDLRRPALANYFGLDGASGLTDVALGYAPLEDALHEIPIVDPGRADAAVPHRLSAAHTLDVLPSGALPPNPGEFVQTPELAAIIAALRERYETVLIDSPPMLRVGDTLALSPRVDGLLVVVRLGVIRRPMLNDLRRQLASTPSAKLGIVLTGAELESSRSYGAYAYGAYGSSVAPPVRYQPRDDLYGSAS